MALRKNTIDMLDASIRVEYDTIMSRSESSRNRELRESFRLDRQNWDLFYQRFNNAIVNNGITLNWNQFKYTDVFTNLNLIDSIITSNDTGIYMFIVQSQDELYNLSKYVMYVGISGENNSKRPLKIRLKDYFRIEQVRKRSAVLRLLERYKENIHVAFFLANTTTQILKELEQALIGFFYPPANKDDFPIELQPSKKAF